jgi:hypothetical protein
MNHHPPSPIGRVLTVVLGALPFTVITVLVFGQWPPLARWDQSVAARAASYGATHESVVDFWQVVGTVVLPWTTRAVILVVAAYLWRRRARVLTVWLLTTAGAELGLVQAVKAIFERARPAQMLVETGGFSYVRRPDRAERPLRVRRARRVGARAGDPDRDVDRVRPPAGAAAAPTAYTVRR